MARTTQIATVQFEKKYWTEARARKWLREHRYKATKVESPARFLHYRQNDPKKLRMGHYTQFRTLVLARGLELVIAIKTGKQKKPMKKGRGVSGRARPARKGTSGRKTTKRKTTKRKTTKRKRS